ncbi:hypothetical protein DEO72_LG5g93 [Vigna unguiculata]|uniref:Uncharacterized protein n=1 Tax=Vigna unguiculata TaxID=3917 RepID=A0A4D6LVK4_VIGUN|nr:hypothetical protein DEO72_LG5g93 [Vigna unguiculata]
MEFGKLSYKVKIAGPFLCITVIWSVQVFRNKLTQWLPERLRNLWDSLTRIYDD